MKALSRFPLISAVVPGALTVYLSFNAGGFFGVAPAIVAVCLALVLIARTVAFPSPFEGLSALLCIAGALLGLYAIWALVSATWSHSPAGALLEFDRSLAYLFALLLFGSLPHSVGLFRRVCASFTAGALLVCAVALITRTLPDVWPIAPNVGAERLSYPLTYWNALGLLAALGAVFCFHFSCSQRELPSVRIAASAALPIFAATLLLSFSRGAIAVCAVAIVVYLVLGRPRLALSGIVAGAIPAAVAVAVSYQAKLLATPEWASPQATPQGHRLALVVFGCVIAAAVGRWLLLKADPVFERLTLSSRAIRPIRVTAAVGLCAVVLVGALATDLPARAASQYNHFVAGNSIQTPDTRTRLTAVGNDGRVEPWKVAIAGFDTAVVGGHGAGTYKSLWDQNRPVASTVANAHSLYLEVLAELGVVGLILLGGALVAILVGVARRVRASQKAVYAAAFAAVAAWLIHAGIDWDWQMPAVTLWLFMVGGVALAGTGDKGFSFSMPKPGRAAIALGLVVVAATPALVGLSQAKASASTDAFVGGDCAKAIDEGLKSESWLSVWPQPFEVMGYCDMRAGYAQLSLGAMQSAVDRDPGRWQAHYGLAIAQAKAGIDPRPQAQTALALNPLDSQTQDAVKRLGSNSATDRQRQAQTLSFLLP